MSAVRSKPIRSAHQPICYEDVYTLNEELLPCHLPQLGKALFKHLKRRNPAFLTMGGLAKVQYWLDKYPTLYRYDSGALWVEYLKLKEQGHVLGLRSLNQKPIEEQFKWSALQKYVWSNISYSRPLDLKELLKVLDTHPPLSPASFKYSFCRNDFNHLNGLERLLWVDLLVSRNKKSPMALSQEEFKKLYDWIHEVEFLPDWKNRASECLKKLESNKAAESLSALHGWFDESVLKWIYFNLAWDNKDKSFSVTHHGVEKNQENWHSFLAQTMFSVRCPEKDQKRQVLPFKEWLTWMYEVAKWAEQDMQKSMHQVKPSMAFHPVLKNKVKGKHFSDVMNVTHACLGLRMLDFNRGLKWSVSTEHITTDMWKRLVPVVENIETLELPEYLDESWWKKMMELKYSSEWFKALKSRANQKWFEDHLMEASGPSANKKRL